MTIHNIVLSLSTAAILALLPCQARSQSTVPEWVPSIDIYANSPMLPVRGIEPFGAEELDDYDNAPRIPEPMVFDLVRPLGATRGEAEINTLATIPMNRKAGGKRIPGGEWAPEAEVAIWDGVAIEFELPFQEWTLESYKTAGQITFGTAFDKHYIHGAQGILLYDRQTGNWNPTLLYLAGLQFDENWSALAMLGIRTEINGDDVQNRTERLFNLSVFRHVSDRMTLGLETNSAITMGGDSEFLLIPQVHWELQDRFMLQFGTGCNFNKHASTPLSAFRAIYSF